MKKFNYTTAYIYEKVYAFSDGNQYIIDIKFSWNGTNYTYSIIDHYKSKELEKGITDVITMEKALELLSRIV